MIHYIGTTKVPLTVALAEEFATMPAFQGERRLKTKRIDYLAAKLENGLFHSPKWAIAWLNGKKLRVNGQHSSFMLSQANGSFPAGLSAVIDEFVCDTEQDLAELFGQFDAQESIRSTRDICGAHARTIPALAGIADSFINLAVSGIASALRYKGDLENPTTEERARLAYDYPDFILWAMGDGLMRPRHLSRHPIVGAAFSTYCVNREVATDFWKMVRDETNTDHNHPTRVLARFLRDVSSRGTRPTGHKWEGRSVYSKCIHAWNAFRRGETITHVKYYPNAPIADAK